MNAADDFKFNTYFVIYEAIKEIMDNSPHWWSEASEQDVIRAVMKKLRGHYNPDIVRQCIEND